MIKIYLVDIIIEIHFKYNLHSLQVVLTIAEKKVYQTAKNCQDRSWQFFAVWKIFFSAIVNTTLLETTQTF
jgi:hypothetical protein